jgi:hypothetical protein
LLTCRKPAVHGSERPDREAVETVPSGKKRKRKKIATHKRKKRRRADRHKKKNR